MTGCTMQAALLTTVDANPLHPFQGIRLLSYSLLVAMTDATSDAINP